MKYSDSARRRAFTRDQDFMRVKRLARIKEFFSIIQSIVIVLSIVIGGIWAGMKYFKLHEQEIAKVNYQAALKALNGQSAFGIEINNHVVADTLKGEYQLFSEVIYTNSGTASISFDLSGLSYTAIKLPQQNKQKRYVLKQATSMKGTKGIRIPMKTSSNCIYQLILTEPGYYLLELRIESGFSDRIKSYKDSGSYEFRWYQSSLVEVK